MVGVSTSTGSPKNEEREVHCIINAEIRNELNADINKQATGKNKECETLLIFIRGTKNRTKPKSVTLDCIISIRQYELKIK